jgi:tetratricopeptide (TPR) repeat protein
VRAEFETALALAPSRVENQLDEIDYLINAPAIAGGDKKKALAMVQDTSSSDPAGGYLALAKVALAQKEESKLESLYLKAVTADPRRYEARIMLGVFYSAAPHENPALSEQHARIALELNPDRIGAYRLLAYALAAQKRLDEADRVLARRRRLFQMTSVLVSTQAACFYGKAAALRRPRFTCAGTLLKPRNPRQARHILRECTGRSA